MVHPVDAVLNIWKEERGNGAGRFITPPTGYDFLLAMLGAALIVILAKWIFS